MRLGPLSLLAVGLMGAALADEVTPQPVHAERAFQKSVSELGFRNGFLAHVADDAIMFGPAPRNAKAQLTEAPDDGSGKDLAWWPLYRRHLDRRRFGFTTGGATRRSSTSPCGASRPTDRGSGSMTAARARRSCPRPRRIARRPCAGCDRRSRVRRSRARGDRAARGRLPRLGDRRRGAHNKYLADDGRVIGSGLPPSVGRPSARPSSRAGRRRRRQRAGRRRRATGDMAYTYGEIRYEVEGEKRWGHYVASGRSEAKAGRSSSTQ